MQEARLGVDIGRVIIGGGDQPGADTSFLDGDEDRAMATPAVPGALETLPLLVQAFSGRVWLVSKCGPKVQGRTRRWLRQHGFSQQTGIPMENLRFCLQRPQKADHARQLRLTHGDQNDRPSIFPAQPRSLGDAHTKSKQTLLQIP